MKFQTLGLFILLLLLAANVYMFVKLKEIDENVEHRTSAHHSIEHGEEKDDDDDHHQKIDFIGIMKDNFYFMDKLYFAGQAENWDLAGFYHHEIEEGMEQVINNQFHYDEADITMLSKSMFVPQFEAVKESIDKKDKAIFDESYKMLVINCNNCHVASDHGFIKITVPKTSTYTNQIY